MSRVLVRLSGLLCAIGMLVTLTGCGPMSEEDYRAEVEESLRTSLLVASDAYYAIDRANSEAPEPPEAMPSSSIDTVRETVGTAADTLRREADKLGDMNPPAGYSASHADIAAAVAGMAEAAEAIDDVVRDIKDTDDRGDIIRDSNRAELWRVFEAGLPAVSRLPEAAERAGIPLDATWLTEIVQSGDY